MISAAMGGMKGRWSVVRATLCQRPNPCDRDGPVRLALVQEADADVEEHVGAGHLALVHCRQDLEASLGPALLEQLPPRMRSELEGINPAAHDLSRMRANVILLHGRSDNLIPYTESIALADSLPANQVQLFIIDGLAHVNFRPKAYDVPQLLGAMEILLAERMPLALTLHGHDDHAVRSRIPNVSEVLVHLEPSPLVAAQTERPSG